jgi:hypothetical protein
MGAAASKRQPLIVSRQACVAGDGWFQGGMALKQMQPVYTGYCLAAIAGCFTGFPIPTQPGEPDWFGVARRLLPGPVSAQTTADSRFVATHERLLLCDPGSIYNQSINEVCGEIHASHAP